MSKFKLKIYSLIARKMQIYHFTTAKQATKGTLLLSKMLKKFVIKGLMSWHKS